MKVKGRYIWAAVVAVGAFSSAVSTFHQESGTNLAAAITDAAVSLVVGWIIYWVGIVIFRAFAKRGKPSPIPTDHAIACAESRKRKKYRSVIVVALLIVMVVVGLVIVKGSPPDLTRQATLTDYYPCLATAKAEQALKAGGAPSQTLINALISTGKTASDPEIRKGAKQMAAAYRTPISKNAGTSLLVGIGNITEGCKALHNPAP